MMNPKKLFRKSQKDLGEVMQNIMDIDTVALNEKEDAVRIIDQTKLPSEIDILDLRQAKEMYDAIYRLEVRGAPAIGVFAALSMYVLSLGRDIVENVERQIPVGTKPGMLPPEDAEGFSEWFHATADYLNSSRPTAVNLSWALNRMTELVDQELNAAESASQNAPAMDAAEIASQNAPAKNAANFRKDVLPKLHDLAIEIRDEDIEVCRKIGENGLALIKPGDGILTHCNAGKLATVRYGTATAPVYLAEEKGYHLRVYCDETRPLLQGARLTAFELSSSGVDTTLLCDNMSGSLMREGKVDAIFVGCDRVAANGDTANKIGTSVVAAVAKQYGIPMYICAPTSTIDMNTPTGEEIVIEQRNPDEVTEMWYEKRMAPENVKVYNPAFDVTDHELLAGIVTEYGIARAPYEESFKEIFRKKEEAQKS